MARPTEQEQAAALDRDAMAGRWAAPTTLNSLDEQQQQQPPSPPLSLSADGAQAQARAVEADQSRLSDQGAGQSLFGAGERYDAALAIYQAANTERIERLESRLETLVENQEAEISERQAHPPGFWAGRQAKAEWSAGIEQAQDRLQTLQRRHERVRQLEARTEELAEDRLRRDEPELTRERDAERLQERREQQARWREQARERQEQQSQARAGHGHDLAALER